MLQRLIFPRFLSVMVIGICALLCAFSKQNMWAQTAPAQVFPPNIIMLDSAQEYSILPQCSFYRDAEGKMSVADILRIAQQQGFKTLGEVRNNFLEQMSSSVRVRGEEVVWVRFTVHNAKLLDWVLLVGNARIDSAILYTPNTASAQALMANDFLSSVTGEFTELRQRALQSKHSAFPLALADEESYTFYLRVSALYTPAALTMRISPAEAFLEANRLWETIASVMLGMILFAAVFNMIPLVIVRDRVYFWYVVHVLSLFLYSFATTTLLSERFITLPAKPLASAIIQLGTYIVFIQFVRVFMSIQQELPKVLDRLLLASMALTLMVIFFIPLGWKAQYTYWRVPILVTSGCLLLIVLAREFLRTTDLSTRLYTFMMMLAVATKFAMHALGHMHEALITSGVGVAETMLFSFALAARLTQMREQIVEEQQQRAFAEKINEQERIRNKELASANEEIRRQNHILEEQAREIELTNTHLNEVILELDTALTDLKETQTQLVASERLSAVGMLTAGVMHEINNPNAAVYAALEQMQLKEQDIRSFFIGLLSDEDKESPDAKKFLTMVDEVKRMNTLAMEGSNRVKQIVASLRTFTKHQEAGMKTASLKDELVSTIEMFRYQFKTVAIKQEYIGKASIEANFGEINQVFLNLFVNAAQAGATEIILHSEERDDMLVVTVSDDAGGIPPDVAAHIFEPFYTTKGAANSGLGLSISKKIIERHNATMSVESELGKGTIFWLTFHTSLTHSQQNTSNKA
ncbi:MAG: hypothetical protein EAZ92_13770 [Candidatus Kapaibacterium sp.]|nr:MAG: hypothetical protein EAZ92_13770 [Candidatus Kapabacteria bacterium]